MVHHPLHHEHVHPTGSFHVSTDDRIQMDVDLPQVTIALDSIKILETGLGLGMDKNSKGTVVKYHPISKIEADHLMILPVGTKVSIHGLKTRTEPNNTFGCITEIDLSKQRYFVNSVNLLTDGSCIAMKFDRMLLQMRSPKQIIHLRKLINQFIGWLMLLRKRFLIFLKTMDQSIDLRRLAHWSTLHNLVQRRYNPSLLRIMWSSPVSRPTSLRGPLLSAFLMRWSP